MGSESQDWFSFKSMVQGIVCNRLTNKQTIAKFRERDSARISLCNESVVCNDNIVCNDIILCNTSVVCREELLAWLHLCGAELDLTKITGGNK